MASGKGNYWKNKQLNAEFNGATITQPTSLWIRLYTTALTPAGVGTEVAAASYDPVEIDCNNTNFPTTADGEMENAVQIPFGTAATAWGTLLGWGAWDAETGGNLHYWGDFDPGIVVGIGAILVIPVGMLIFASDNEA